MLDRLFSRSLRTSFARALKARLHLEEMESRLVPYGATTNAWPHPELITLSIVPDGTVVAAGKVSNMVSTLDNHPVTAIRTGWRTEILRAAQAWAEKTNINFALIGDDGSGIGAGAYQQGDPDKGDIRIGGYHMGTTAPLGLAYAPPPVNNYSIAGDIQLNMSRSWNVGSTYDFFTVAMHEIGHTLGLNHANNTSGGSTSAVMWSSYQGTRTGPSTDDTNGIRNKYSSNLARSADQYDLAASNDAIWLATAIDSLVNTNATALIPSADLSTTSDVDYYAVTAPLNTTGTLTVNLQSAGLSLLSPQLTVYAADMTTVLGWASAAGDYDGATLSVTLEGVNPLDQFYIEVTGAETATNWQMFNTGQYGLSLTFGANASPSIPLPNTQTSNGTPLSSGGGQAYQYNTEFRLNTYITGAQKTGSVTPQSAAMDATGNYVVVWASYAQDGSSSGIYAQRYNKDGVAQGSEFRVNTTTVNDQNHPAVAMAPNGNFVVTWSSSGQDGSGYGIFAQRFDQNGVMQGNEFRVNTYTAGAQRDAKVAMDMFGNFVIVWTSMGQIGSFNEVYAQRFNAVGVPQGSEFRVNTYTEDDQDSADIAMTPDGRFVVVWESSNQDGSWDGVYAQRYNAAGIAQGTEFRVNTNTEDDQDTPTVAVDSFGNFAVAFSQYTEVDDDEDYSGFDVYVRRYNYAGTDLGDEFRVNTTTVEDQDYASVGMDKLGNILVTWSSYGQDGSGWGIYGQQYSFMGANLGTEFRVSTTTSGDQRESSVVISGIGRALVTWAGNGPGDSSGMFGQMYEINSGSGLMADFDLYGDVDHDHNNDGVLDHVPGSGCSCSACQAAAQSDAVTTGGLDSHSINSLDSRESQADTQDLVATEETFDPSLAPLEQHATLDEETEEVVTRTSWREASDAWFAQVGEELASDLPAWW